MFHRVVKQSKPSRIAAQLEIDCVRKNDELERALKKKNQDQDDEQCMATRARLDFSLKFCIYLF
jgi:hypothetical protein